MFLVGKKVRGGHYGTPPSLENLDVRNNLFYMTDFRKVYATVVKDWLGAEVSRTKLKSDVGSLSTFI